MNQLSWMIYWASVADGIGVVIGTIFFGGMVASGLLAIGCAMWATERGWHKDEGGEWSPRSGLTLAAKAVVGILIFGVAASFFPSKNTLYAIAASQAGEQVVTSETGVKAMKALNAWLDKQAAS